MITTGPDGSTTFRVYRGSARSVHLVGSFNGWNRHNLPLKRGSDGWWSCTVFLQPGEYDFNYLVDGYEWAADFAAYGVSLNDYGIWVSHLLIAPQTADAATSQQAPVEEAAMVGSVARPAGARTADASSAYGMVRPAAA